MEDDGTGKAANITVRSPAAISACFPAPEPRLYLGSLHSTTLDLGTRPESPKPTVVTPLPCRRDGREHCVGTWASAAGTHGRSDEVTRPTARTPLPQSRRLPRSQRLPPVRAGHLERERACLVADKANKAQRGEAAGLGPHSWRQDQDSKAGPWVPVCARWAHGQHLALFPGLASLQGPRNTPEGGKLP